MTAARISDVHRREIGPAATADTDPVMRSPSMPPGGWPVPRRVSQPGSPPPESPVAALAAGLTRLEVAVERQGDEIHALTGAVQALASHEEAERGTLEQIAEGIAEMNSRGARREAAEDEARVAASHAAAAQSDAKAQAWRASGAVAGSVAKFAESRIGGTFLGGLLLGGLLAAASALGIPLPGLPVEVEPAPTTSGGEPHNLPQPDTRGLPQETPPPLGD